MNSICRTALLLLLVLVGACNRGSSRPPTYPVTGTVTLKGKPLEGATVVFVPAEGAAHEAATGTTDAAGKYKLSTYTADDGANAGEYRIKVSKFDLRKPTKEEQDAYISYEEEQKRQFSTDEKPTPPAKNILLPKYGNEATSGLTFTVNQSGPNVFDISLD